MSAPLYSRERSLAIRLSGLIEEYLREKYGPTVDIPPEEMGGDELLDLWLGIHGDTETPGMAHPPDAPAGGAGG